MPFSFRGLSHLSNMADDPIGYASKELTGPGFPSGVMKVSLSLAGPLYLPLYTMIWAWFFLNGLNFETRAVVASALTRISFGLSSSPSTQVWILYPLKCPRTVCGGTASQLSRAAVPVVICTNVKLVGACVGVSSPDHPITSTGVTFDVPFEFTATT